MVTVVIPETSRAANAKTAELLQGSQIAYAPFDGILTVYAAASAIGMQHTLMVGGEVVLDDQEVAAIRAAGVGVNKDADMVLQVGVRRGDQLRYFQRNSTAGAITTKAIFDLL